MRFLEWLRDVLDRDIESLARQRRERDIARVRESHEWFAASKNGRWAYGDAEDLLGCTGAFKKVNGIWRDCDGSAVRVWRWGNLVQEGETDRDS